MKNIDQNLENDVKSTKKNINDLNDNISGGAKERFDEIKATKENVDFLQPDIEGIDVEKKKCFLLGF